VKTARRATTLPGRASAAALACLVFSAATPAADVALLKSSEAAPWRPAVDAFRRVAAGHTVIEYDLRGERAEATRVLGTLKGHNVILVAMGPLAAQAAHETTPELPLVFCMVQDPAKAGLQGAANTAGVAFVIPVKNQLAAFRMVNPRARRVGVIYNAENVGRLVQEAQKAAVVVRLVVVEKAVATEREVPEALRALLQGGDAVDALWFPPDPLLMGAESRRFVLSETLKAGKPVYSSMASLVPEGALVSNSPDFPSIGEQVGELVNRIASGDKRFDLLVPRAELLINKKIADKLKVDVPADALKAASRVF
jgi:putative tryptophan/tyrosine transport system substrate-binding protein